MKRTRIHRERNSLQLSALCTGVTTVIPTVGSFDFKMLKRGSHVSPAEVANFYNGIVKHLRHAKFIGTYTHQLGTVAEITIIRQRYHASKSPTTVEGLVHLATYGALGPFCELETPTTIAVTPYITYTAASTPS